MRLLCFVCLFVSIAIIRGDDFEKYRPLREQCQRTPSSPECIQVKTKLFEVVKKCQTVTTQQQLNLCRQVKETLCAIFPASCAKPTSSTAKTNPKPTTKQTSGAKKTITDQSKSVKATKSAATPKIVVVTKKPSSKLTSALKSKSASKLTSTSKSTSTTTTAAVTQGEHLNDEEFVQVPVNPDDLRTRGEYCVRHGKEKKCQVLLNNLKNTYSTCSRKKPSTAPPTKPEQLDCHSFQSHLCKAFPKFPPCTKNASSN